MKRLRATEVYTGSSVKVIAVESVELRYSRTRSGGHLFGRLEPIAVVVCSRHGAYALDMQARAADLDRLREQVPTLDAVVDAFTNEAH